jgi:cellulose synthase/poly-beta-1,6-N-acetylglucosamine synthase-like glycosyltransferase
VVNGCKVERGEVSEAALPRSFLARVQTLEYLRAFLLARVAMSYVGTLTIVSGALGLFDRRVLLEVGGFGLDTCGEDFELVVKMHRHMREQGVPYRIAFVADPVCWTEVPESLAGLSSQRARWQRGSIETVIKHRKIILNPAYGRIGLAAFGRILAVDFIGPFMTVLGYLIVPLFWAFGMLSVDYFLAFVGLDISFGIFISVAALLLEELEFRRFPGSYDLAILTVTALVENAGYRQLSNFWRLKGFYDYFRGSTEWVEISRKGFG